ncbi:MAG: hypothetical protein WCF66_22665 [Pseudolabrys sp.]
MALLPKTSSDLKSIDLQVLPPRLLIASPMHLPMVPAAERHGELVADLKTDRPRLCKAEMMGIRRLPSTD